MTRDEIAAAFRTADEHLESLRPRLLAHAELPLLSGDWRVRDALSHIAARSNSVPIAQRWLDRVDATVPGDAAIPDIHDMNAGQVATRTGRSIDELLDEAIAGHAAAVQHARALDDALLTRPIRIHALNIDTTFGGFLVTAGPGHESHHLAEIEAALDQAP